MKSLTPDVKRVIMEFCISRDVQFAVGPTAMQAMQQVTGGDCRWNNTHVNALGACVGPVNTVNQTQHAYTTGHRRVSAQRWFHLLSKRHVRKPANAVSCIPLNGYCICNWNIDRIMWSVWLLFGNCMPRNVVNRVQHTLMNIVHDW